MCLFSKHKIWINKDLPLKQKEETLLHELFHCYKGSFITFNSLDNTTADIWCNISANSHDIIHKIINNYF